MSLRLTATAHNEPSAKRRPSAPLIVLAPAAAEPEVAVNWEEAGRLAELPPIFPVKVKRRTVQS
jgi:hypothetical protein